MIRHFKKPYSCNISTSFLIETFKIESSRNLGLIQKGLKKPNMIHLDNRDGDHNIRKTHACMGCAFLVVSQFNTIICFCEI